MSVVNRNLARVLATVRTGVSLTILLPLESLSQLTELRQAKLPINESWNAKLSNSFGLCIMGRVTEASRQLVISTIEGRKNGS